MPTRPGGWLRPPDGNLYGTTSEAYGAQDGYGTVFSITPGGALTTLHTFDLSDGAWPAGGLLQDTNGKLYGTTNGGGDLSCEAPYGCGTVFALDMGLGPFVTFVRAAGKVGADRPHPRPRFHWNHQCHSQRNPGQLRSCFRHTDQSHGSCWCDDRLRHCDHAQRHAHQQCAVPRDQVILITTLAGRCSGMRSPAICHPFSSRHRSGDHGIRSACPWIPPSRDRRQSQSQCPRAFVP